MPQSSFEKIVAMIPGYGGYVEAEDRRAEDRELRKLLAKRLDESKADVAKKMKQMTDAGEFDLLKIADGFHKQLDTAAQKTLAATEGYSGWFDKKAVDAAKLKNVVELDESLLSLTDRIQKSLPENLEQIDEINAAGDLIAEYLERFETREKILHG